MRRPSGLIAMTPTPTRTLAYTRDGHNQSSALHWHLPSKNHPRLLRGARAFADDSNSKQNRGEDKNRAADVRLREAAQHIGPEGIGISANWASYGTGQAIKWIVQAGDDEKLNSNLGSAQTKPNQWPLRQQASSV